MQSNNKGATSPIDDEADQSAEVATNAISEIGSKGVRDHEAVAPGDETNDGGADNRETVLHIEKVDFRRPLSESGEPFRMSVRLAGAIGKRFGVPTPLPDILENGSMEPPPEWLSKEAKRPTSPLVRLQHENEERPFFRVHPVGGAVFCYADLARSLGPGRKCQIITRRWSLFTMRPKKLKNPCILFKNNIVAKSRS